MIKLLWGVFFILPVFATAQETAETFEIACLDIITPSIYKVETLDRVQLMGIILPDEDDKYYSKAMDFVKGKLKGKTIKVVLSSTTPSSIYDCKKAVIYYQKGGGWRDIALDLLENGYCKADIVNPGEVDTIAYQNAQEEAKGAKKGLWKQWWKEHEAEKMETKFGKYIQ